MSCIGPSVTSQATSRFGSTSLGICCTSTNERLTRIFPNRPPLLLKPAMLSSNKMLKYFTRRASSIAVSSCAFSWEIICLLSLGPNHTEVANTGTVFWSVLPNNDLDWRITIISQEMDSDPNRSFVGNQSSVEFDITYKVEARVIPVDHAC
jgi:hypothetical protein